MPCPACSPKNHSAPIVIHLSSRLIFMFCTPPSKMRVPHICTPYLHGASAWALRQRKTPPGWTVFCNMLLLFGPSCRFLLQVYHNYASPCSQSCSLVLFYTYHVRQCKLESICGFVSFYVHYAIILLTVNAF